jgi:hypothetical protein
LTATSGGQAGNFALLRRPRVASLQILHEQSRRCQQGFNHRTDNCRADDMGRARPLSERRPV